MQRVRLLFVVRTTTLSATSTQCYNRSVVISSSPTVKKEARCSVGDRMTAALMLWPWRTLSVAILTDESGHRQIVLLILLAAVPRTPTLISNYITSIRQLCHFVDRSGGNFPLFSSGKAQHLASDRRYCWQVFANHSRDCHTTKITTTRGPKTELFLSYTSTETASASRCTTAQARGWLHNQVNEPTKTASASRCTPAQARGWLHNQVNEPFTLLALAYRAISVLDQHQDRISQPLYPSAGPRVAAQPDQYRDRTRHFHTTFQALRSLLGRGGIRKRVWSARTSLATTAKRIGCELLGADR
ncbi:hypothetical protein J6590_004835 [Homalodisca vitripennis]|nr:hypothetical protein J6590_004835 [Homalodisca vitripennis]